MLSDYDAIRERFNMACMVDSVIKDWSSHRGDRRTIKQFIKEAYNYCLTRHPSKAEGKRNLGNLSDWYDGVSNAAK